MVVNGIIQKDQVGKDAAEFVRNRVKMQDDHMEEIWQIFGGQVRALVLLFETEVKGGAMLNRLVGSFFHREQVHNTAFFVADCAASCKDKSGQER